MKERANFGQVQGVDHMFSRIVGTLTALLRGTAPPRVTHVPVLALPAPHRVAEPEPPAPAILKRLHIPVRTSTIDDELSRAMQERGQFLARQEMWPELAEEMAEADFNRKVTPGGTPIAELLAYGARLDIVLAADHALFDGAPEDETPLRADLLELEDVRREFPEEPMIATVLALAHTDVGWAWRGNWDTTVPELHRQRCVAHLDRAAEIMAPWNGIELDSPLIAAAHCALLAGRRDPNARVADDYEDLIDLDPGNPRHMRSLGYHLLPRWFGDYDQIELQARRTAARTQDIWGLGGYTWVQFDAIALDAEACARLDLEFFIDGMRDILKARPDQETANLLAAYCAIAMRYGQGESAAADEIRMQIVDCAEWLIRKHMTEIHPLIWAHASDGFDNNARVSSVSRFAARGRVFALQAIADIFEDDIANGLEVSFTPDGPQTERV